MICVCSAVSGEEITVFDAEEFQSKTVKDLKQRLSTQIHCSRFRQRLYVQNDELQDDEVLEKLVNRNLQLVILEFWPEEFSVQAMLYACQRNQPDYLEELLRRPHVPNVKCPEGWTLLHHAAENGNLECVNLLLEAGAKSDEMPEDGGTPLHLAAWGGYVEIVDKLLDARADKDKIAGIEGEPTPILLAAEAGHVDIVSLLLQVGVDKDAATKDSGQTSLHFAASQGNLQLTQLLLEFGVDTKKITNGSSQNTGATALHAAAWNGHLEIVSLLLDHGAEKDAPTSDNGETPLHYAARRGHVEIAKVLLEAGADKDRVTTDNCATPLHAAACNRRPAVVELLLEKGADKEKATTQGETAWQLAKTMFDDSTLTVFQSHSERSSGKGMLLSFKIDYLCLTVVHLTLVLMICWTCLKAQVILHDFTCVRLVVMYWCLMIYNAFRAGTGISSDLLPWSALVVACGKASQWQQAVQIGAGDGSREIQVHHHIDMKYSTIVIHFDYFIATHHVQNGILRHQWMNNS